MQLSIENWYAFFDNDCRVLSFIIKCKESVHSSGFFGINRPDSENLHISGIGETIDGTFKIPASKNLRPLLHELKKVIF